MHFAGANHHLAFPSIFSSSCPRRPRIALDPFNAVATGIFVLAIVHTFAAPRFAALAHDVQHRHDARARAAGRAPSPSVGAELSPVGL